MFRLWCAQKDGECYTFSPETETCDMSLSGADCEAVYSVVTRGENVFTASKDRIIRGYQV